MNSTAGTKSEHDTRARNYVAIANAWQSAIVKIDGVPCNGVRLVKLTKEELEKVHGSENEATG